MQAQRGSRTIRDQAILDITQKLVEVCQPVRIYLFGSAAREDDGPDSDLDFLVVLPDNSPEEIFRTDKLSDALAGIRHAADVIPWRQSDFEGRAAFVVASLPATVVREGKLLYDAGRMAA